jgi:hypothetical protein
MRVRQTITTTGAQAPVMMDMWQTPFDVYLAVEIPAGTTATVTAQHTGDDITNAAITPIWFPDAVINAVTKSTEGGSNAPALWVRLNVASISGGPVNFVVNQGMARGN